MYKSGVTGKNRFTWFIIITNLHSVDALRPLIAEDGGEGEKGNLLFIFYHNVRTQFAYFSDKLILTLSLLIQTTSQATQCTNTPGPNLAPVNCNPSSRRTTYSFTSRLFTNISEACGPRNIYQYGQRPHLEI